MMDIERIPQKATMAVRPRVRSSTSSQHISVLIEHTGSTDTTDVLKKATCDPTVVVIQADVVVEEEQQEQESLWRDVCQIYEHHYPPSLHVSRSSHPNTFVHLGAYLATMDCDYGSESYADGTSPLLSPCTSITTTVSAIMQHAITVYIRHLYNVFFQPLQFYQRSEFTTPNGYLEKNHIITFMHINRRLAERSENKESAISAEKPVYSIRRTPRQHSRSTSTPLPKLGSRRDGTYNSTQRTRSASVTPISSSSAITPSPCRSRARSASTDHSTSTTSPSSVIFDEAAVAHYYRIKNCVLELVTLLRVWKESDVRVIIRTVMILDEMSWRCSGPSDPRKGVKYTGKCCEDRVLIDLRLA